MNEQACEQLTLFPVGSLASHSPQLGSEKELPMTVTSGRKCSGLLRSSTPLGLLAKMLLESSVWQSRLRGLKWKAVRLPETRTQISTVEYIHDKKLCYSQKSLKTSKIAGTMSRHLLFQLAVSMPHTSAAALQLWLTTPVARESSKGQSKAFRGKNKVPTPSEFVQMFPTPTASMAEHGGPNQRCSSGRPGLQMAAMMWQTPNVPNGGRVNPTNMSPTGKMPDGRKRQVGLEHQVGMVEKGLWPTPSARCGTGSSSTATRQGSADLQTAVQMFPTPTTRDWKDTTSKVPPSRQDPSKQTLGQRMAYLREVNGQLNPDWVEWLMGFPIGWTALDADVEHPAPPAVGAPWPDEPTGIPRVASGIPNRVDRLKCLGNAVVPQQFYPIFKAITEIESREIDK